MNLHQHVCASKMPAYRQACAPMSPRFFLWPCPCISVVSSVGYPFAFFRAVLRGQKYPRLPSSVPFRFLTFPFFLFPFFLPLPFS